MRRVCTARRKDGEPCGGWAMRGADKCRMHVGRRGADVRTEHKARAELARLSLPPVDDPLSALAAVTAEVLAWKDQMAGLVNKLTGVRYDGGEGGEQLRAEVALFERALDRCEKFLTAMARLDIDDRLARITEARAAVFVAVLLAALGAVPHPDREGFLAAVDAEFGRQGG